MGMFESIRLRLAAALSPEQMTQQYSRPRTAIESNPFVYKGDELDCEDYDKMLMDPQIKAGYELIRMFLLSRKIVITPASEDESDVEIAEALESNLKDMKYPMRKVRNDMYSAIIYGYSVSEIVWGKEEGDENIKIDRIRPIPIDTLEDCFEYNEMGDLEKIVQTVPNEDPIEIDADKCLVYTYDEQFGDRRGKSILDGVYDNWYHKQRVLEWWNVFLQKHEGPTLLGKIENPQFKDEFRMQLEDVREGRTNITVGINDDVKVLESSHRGEGFKEAINYHDVMIFRKMNIGTMILGQEDGSGAYSQSQTQFDTLSIFLDGIHEDIAAELQAKIKELVDMNWNVDDYPVLSFETFEEKDLLGLIGKLEPLIKDMAIDPNDMWFRHLLADVISRYSDVDTHELLEEEDETEMAENDEGKRNEQSAPVEPTVTATPEEQAAVDKESTKNVLDALQLPNANAPGQE